MKLFRVAGWWMVLSAASIASATPFLEGSVTDDQGRPIEGASIKIWDCIGTCFGGTTVLSDAEGHYVFEKKPFQNSPLLTVDLPGRYEVSRDETGPALNAEDASTPRRIDFVLGTPAAAYVRLEGEVPEGWTQKLLFRSGREVKLQRYDFDSNGERDGTRGSFELLPRNEPLHLAVVREPVVKAGDDPKETRERQRQSWRDRVEIVAPPLRLVDPQRYDIRAAVVPGADGAAPSIVVQLVRDALGNDRTDELTDKDPRFGPPVDAAAQEQGIALLKKVKLAAAPWNGTPDNEIASYEYDFVAGDGERTHVKIDHNSPAGPAWSDIARQRGFAYMPPLRWLFSQPENVVFHAVEIDDDRAVLQYQLRSNRGFGAGLGIGPSWNGFFTSNFKSGTIVVDVKNATVLEHRLSRGPLDEESVETFGDYVAVGEGFAPRRLRIQSGGMDFRLAFRIHEDKVWLLDEAFHGEEQQPAAKIENVVVKLGG